MPPGEKAPKSATVEIGEIEMLSTEILNSDPKYEKYVRAKSHEFLTNIIKTTGKRQPGSRALPGDIRYIINAIINSFKCEVKSRVRVNELIAPWVEDELGVERPRPKKKER